MTRALPVPLTTPPGSPRQRRAWARARSAVAHAAAGLARANRFGDSARAAAYRQDLRAARARLARCRRLMEGDSA